jgi:Stress responsive A/B Barrel Domain
MIKHIVMFKVKESANGADKSQNIRRIKSDLEALPEKIAEIKFFEVGTNFSNAGMAYDLVLISEFESKEDLYSYQKHPDHVKVANFVNSVCENRIVADYIV